MDILIENNSIDKFLRTFFDNVRKFTKDSIWKANVISVMCVIFLLLFVSLSEIKLKVLCLITERVYHN